MAGLQNLPNDREVFPETRLLEIFEKHEDKKMIMQCINDIQKDHMRNPRYMDYLANYRDLIRNELLFPIYDESDSEDDDDDDDDDESWYYADLNSGNTNIMWVYTNYKIYNKDNAYSEDMVKELIILDKRLAKEQDRYNKKI